jgi:hypothetical protein
MKKQKCVLLTTAVVVSTAVLFNPRTFFPFLCLTPAIIRLKYASSCSVALQKGRGTYWSHSLSVDEFMLCQPQVGVLN